MFLVGHGRDALVDAEVGGLVGDVVVFKAKEDELRVGTYAGAVVVESVNRLEDRGGYQTSLLKLFREALDSIYKLEYSILYQ